jgi:hypothetical protein
MEWRDVIEAARRHDFRGEPEDPVLLTDAQAVEMARALHRSLDREPTELMGLPVTARKFLLDYMRGVIA